MGPMIQIHNQKGEYGAWVPEEEVEVIGNSERFWREKMII